MAECLITPVGCLKEIGKIIITNCLWPPIKRHVDYWWCFDNNIQVLRDGVRDLDRETFDINQKIEEARLHTEKLRPGVEEWSKAGTEKLVEATRILQDDINPKAWNLISRYSMGKRVKKAAEEIAKHRNDGNFNAIADPAPPPAMGFTPHRSTMDFVSRNRIEEDIIKSLKESSVGMIGICGMGGVGKTTMAQRIRVRVMEEKLFDEAVMVVVSQQIDIVKIQKEVAELLGLKFDVESMPARAGKLQNRLMDTKRKIVILDDVWESLKLEDLGVSFESGFERCKILLTTRLKDVCEEMEVQKIFAIEILTTKEAWLLFKEKAGACVEDSVLLPVAKDVVAECKGLPIALVTVGKALQNREKTIWLDSLSQLRQANPADFPEVLADVYKPLKLSYDYLDNESERLLFFICCLFPEDYVIHVEQLAWYIMGLQIIDNLTSIEQARNRTCRLVDKLKSRFLLIDGGQKHRVKMHDVVRDVAIYIGSKEKYCLAKSLNKISTENSSDINCNWMSVDISNEPMNVDMGLRFPKLRLLMLLNLSYDISLEGIGDLNVPLQGIRDLKVLSFSNISLGSLPQTLGLLQNLRTLYLQNCKVEDISVIGKLVGLEILYCHYCYEIKELPAEIGRLNRLRLLQLNGCRGLQRIAFDILSSLVQLEELRMLGSFKGWEAEENGKEMRNASVRELESLPNLTCLEIEISNSNLAAQEIRLSPNLVKYCIIIGFHYSLPEEIYNYEKAMILNLPSGIGAVGKWIQILAKNTEYLRLEGDDSNNINVEECQDLRNLVVRNCSTVKKLVKTKDCKSGIVFPMLERLNLYRLHNLEEIWDGTIILNQNLSSLCNLKSVYISFCSNLRCLFSVLVATTCLLQLEVLEIEYCKAIEQVFRNDITDGCIEFPKLKELRLYDLPNLTAFSQGLQTIKFPNLTKTWIGGIVFPMLEKLELFDLKNLEVIWEGTILLNQNVSSLCNLKSVYISFCSNLRYLFSVSVATTCLLQLEVLHIFGCKSMEQVFRNDITDGCIEFPKLKTLALQNLPNLTAFSQGLQTIKFPNLTDMVIDNLPKLNSFCPLNPETPHDDRNPSHFLCNPKVEIGGLKSLAVGHVYYNNVRNIWCHQIPIKFFNNLQALRICVMYGIRSLMPYSTAKNLVSLKNLTIIGCIEIIEVIESNDDDGKEIVDIKCLFPTLKKLEFEYLPKLRMFWQWNHAFELPLLEEVSINNCLEMETFTLGSLNAPNLKRLVINERAIDDMKELNDILHYHFSTKNQNTSMIEEEDANKNEDKDENNIEYNNENVNDEDEGKRK